MASGLSSGMRWSTASVVGRELSRALFTVIIARLVGPEDFGIVAQAMVYIGIVGLLVDQGFSSALIQRPQIERDMPGAVVTVNLAVGVVLMLMTIAIAPMWASFMGTPELMWVLFALSPSLFLRSAGVTFRAMLMRNMDFRKIGIADIAAAVCGGALGVLAALAGGSYWSVVVQTLAADVTYLVVLLAFGAGWRPNRKLGLLREIAGFSGRAFAAGILINSVSRNVDNLLVGKFQGPEALAFYGLAYRLLLLPVQLAGATVGAVLFPAFSKLADNLPALRDELARATRALATLSLPVMGLIAAAAPQLVDDIFGPKWEAAIPIAQVLALAGAVQAIYLPSTTPLVLGLGQDKLNLRYAWLTTAVATVGIVAGLPFGPLGVALGYTAATVVLVPVEWLIRRHLLGVTLREQFTVLLPGLHVALWTAGAYILVASEIENEFVALSVGVSVSVIVAYVVLRVAHRRLLAEFVFMGKRMLGRGKPAADETASSDSPETAASTPAPEAGNG